MKQRRSLLPFLLICYAYTQGMGQAFQWAIHMGGPQADAAQDLFIDPAGNVFTTGRYVGTADFDPGPGVVTLSGSGIFFAKYGPAGNLIWAKSLASGGSNYSLSMAGDAFSNLILTGHFSGIQDFDPGPGMYPLNSNGGSAVFLAKYDSDGNILWAKSWGSSGADGGQDVQTDAAGNILVGGYFKLSTDFDPGPASVNLTAVGGEDLFISKFDPNGNFIWVNTLGGTGDDACLSLAIDATGQLVATGYFESTVDFDPGPGVATLSATGSADAFILKFNTLGELVWAGALGGNTYDAGESIEMDASGAIVLTGHFTGTVDFDLGSGVVNLVSAGSSDIFLARFDADASLKWAKKVGGSSQDYGDDLSIDECGTIFVTGYFSGTADFDPGAGVFNLTSAGDKDAFLARYDSLGALIWAHPIGGNGTDFGLHIEAAYDHVYLTGYFENTADFDTGPTNFPLSSAGSLDVFIAKYATCAPVENSISASICAGESYLFDGDTLTTAGAYSAIFQSLSCCDSTVNLTLTVLPALQDTSALTTCDGEVMMVGSVGFVADTLVCLNLSSINGCDSLHCFQLSFRDTFLLRQSIVICEGESVVVGNNTYTQSGLYTDVFTNQFNCDSTIITELTALPALQLFFDYENLLLSPGDSVQLHPRFNFEIDTFFWNIAGSNFCQTCLEPFVSPDETTLYTLTAFDENGCSVTAAIEVRINRVVSVYLPSAFSPNDDGINDYFRPLGGQQLLAIHRLRVFDRWGGLLYDQTDLPLNDNSGWDGRANGKPLQAGVYVYLVEVSLMNEGETLLSGEVLLVR